MPLYTEGRPHTKEQTGRRLLPLGPGGHHWQSTQPDLNFTGKRIWNSLGARDVIHDKPAPHAEEFDAFKTDEDKINKTKQN